MFMVRFCLSPTFWIREVLPYNSLLPKNKRYIPGHTIETFPEEMSKIRDAGHEM
jgi:hypothetical protein